MQRAECWEAEGEAKEQLSGVSEWLEIVGKLKFPKVNKKKLSNEMGFYMQIF